MICSLTKYIVLKAVPDITAETSMSFLLDVVFEHSCSNVIITDHGSNFIASTFESALKLLKINHGYCTSYRPSANSQIERSNALIAQTLSMYVDDDQKNWSNYVKYTQFLMNTSHQESVKTSPFELLYGYKPRLPFDTIFSPELTDVKRSEQLQQLLKLRETAKQRIAVIQKKMKERVDKTRKEHDFKVGDLIRVKSEAERLDSPRS